jgi:HPt (histidine-containing phosphotransfer) domain-containing protein
MTEAGDPAIDALIAAARADFACGLMAKVAALEDLVSRGAWDDARRAAHKLRGSAGVYGFAGVGASAAALDDLLSSTDQALAATECAYVLETIGELRAEAELATRAAP